MLREIFEVSGLPVFQNKMFHDRDSAIACPRGDMRLVQDMETGLIYNAAFAGLEYDSDYQNEQACSGVFKRHLEQVEAIIARHLAEKMLIEVGCGKGYFLEHMRHAGFRIKGIDPAYEGNNPEVVKARFEPGLGLTAEGIILRHVLEHIPQPCQFLACIAAANGGKGLIYIEVPCLDWIARQRAWFDLFYEHVNYFRLNDFRRMFGTIHESGHVFGGQYLYIVAELASLRVPTPEAGDEFRLPADFLPDINRIVTHGRRNAIWGGASKGVIYALYMQRAGIEVDCVIDINPAKQNKYMAASGLKILSPQQGMEMLRSNDNIHVMNSNYLHEIIEQSNNQFNYIQVDKHEFRE